MKQSWIEYFLTIAQVVASKSKDPTTQVGCVLIGHSNDIRSTGYNGFPRMVSDDPALYRDREAKLLRVVHAEANAVAAAARNGVSLYGTTAIVTKPCCAQCAALLIQAGVVEVVQPPPDPESKWFEQQTVAVLMLKEARVRVALLELEVG
jgi:dCMP deaminase